MVNYRNGVWRQCLLLTILLVAGGALCASKGKGSSVTQPSSPAKVNGAVSKLKREVSPVELRRAANGAIYCLLQNGAEIIVKEKRTAPVVTVQGWVRTGSIHEGASAGAGLSHFCEHLLFKGTKNRTAAKLERCVRAAGGDDNAYTSSERTVYHISGAAEGFSTHFQILADMLMNATFPPEEVKTEHGVVVKEIERAQDSPDQLLWKAFERLRYQVHPYRLPVLGYLERFKRVTRDEVYAYYKRRYSPHLTTFVAVGDFDATIAIAHMARTLSTWQRTDVPEPVIATEPEQVAPREVTVSHPLCKKPKFIIGYPTVNLRHPDLYALDVLAGILGDGRSSRLHRMVKDQAQLVHEIEAYSYTPMYPGVFTISATVDKPKIQTARRLILSIIENARKKKPTKQEIERAKRKVVTEHVFEQMTVEGVARSLGTDWFVAGDLDFSRTYVDGIQAVTAEQVVDVAARYLVPSKINFTLLIPGKTAGPTTSATGRNSARRVITSAKPAGRPAKPVGKDIASSSVTWLGGAWVTEIIFKNGLRVVVREDHSLPAIHGCLAVLGGQRLEPTRRAGASNLLAGVLDRGSKNRSKAAINAFVEDLGARLATFGGRNTIGIDMRSLKDDFPDLFSVGVECFLSPALSLLEIEKQRRGMLAKIEQEDEYLWTMNSKIFRPLMYGTHPYGRQLVGMKETLRRITPSDLRAMHATWMQPRNIGVAFLGDLTVDKALRMVRQDLARLKANRGGKLAPPKMPAIAKAQTGTRRKAGIKGVAIQLGFRTVKIGHPDRETLDVMTALLTGLGGRLNAVIREELGAAYSVGVYHDVQLDAGAIVFYVRTDPQNADRCVQAMWDEIGKLRDHPVPEDELRSAKLHLLGQEAVELQDQGDLCQRLSLSLIYRRTPASIFQRRSRIQKVTGAQLRAAAWKYLTMDRWIKAVVRPASEGSEKK